MCPKDGKKMLETKCCGNCRYSWIYDGLDTGSCRWNEQTEVVRRWEYCVQWCPASIPSRKIILLNLFLGWLGVHRFYVGKNGWGLLYAISLGFAFVGVAVDMVLIARGKFDESVQEATKGEKKFCWCIVALIAIFYIALSGN